MLIELVQTEADLEAVKALDKLLDELMEPLLPAALDMHGFVRRYDGYLDLSRGFALAAREAGEVVGMARCVFGMFTMLESLIVRPEYRGRGVGSALLVAARETAKEKGQKAMTINVLLGNDGAHRLYERAGFADFRSTMIAQL